MAAAYAALVSLMNTLDNIQNHPRLSISLDRKQIESLGEKLDFLLNFVESYNSDHGGISKEEVEDLEREIASAARGAEDVIESHIVDQIIAGSTLHGETNFSFLQDLQKEIKDIKIKVMKVQHKLQPKDENSRLHRVMEGMDSVKKRIIEVEDVIGKSGISLLDLQKEIEDMDSIMKKVVDVKDKSGSEEKQPTHEMPATSSRPLTIEKTTMVGFQDELIQLLDMLTGQQSSRQFISLVGMGGIGKTTLARNVYENPITVHHFDIRAWITVSQEYNVREILFEILSCLGESTSKEDKRIEDELGEKLHKILSGRRYLIILDDIWSIEVWNKIKFFFPDNYNRSRIIVTTRLSNVADHFGSLELALSFLDDKDSWNLFCEKAFAQEGCPPELEQTGKKIVEKCGGLPLSIVLIGGLLRKSSRMHWESMAEDVSSNLNSAEDMLSLSYNNLPACLKPCFLYLGIFPEDDVIHVSQLIKLWVAEGFIKPNGDKSLEEIAEGYIKDLIDRNLIIVCRLGVDGKLKTCYIHDLLRDFCIKVAEKEKFFYVMRELDTPRDVDRERCIVIHRNIKTELVFHTLKSTSVARSVFSESSCELLSESRLLRVLNKAYANPDTIFRHVNSRFLRFSPMSQSRWSDSYQLPWSISVLWNLQTLNSVVKYTKVFAPSAIWEMPQLRHLKFVTIHLPDPPPSGDGDGTILRNLQTLGTVLNFKFSEEACKRMPNIKKLRLEYGGEETLSNYCLYNVGRLNKLESLCCCFVKPPRRDEAFGKNLTLPRSLKKLHLENCWLPWSDLGIIGSLPHLEVLKLYGNAISGWKWEPVEGEFLRLRFLGISLSDLVWWNADSSYFPMLKILVLQHLWDLAEIPSGVGEIPTLKLISLYSCSVSAAISAVKILEEQESLGNQDLKVRVGYLEDWKREEFREMVEKEGFTSPNFQRVGV